MTDIQDNSSKMSENSESAICSGKGDATNEECNLVCSLKKTDNDQNHRLNGLNGLDNTKNEGIDSNTTDEIELSNASGENVKLNGNTEAEASRSDKDEAAISSTNKELGSSEDKLGQCEVESAETLAPIKSENSVKDGVPEVSESNEKFAGIAIENSENPIEITKSTDVKEVGSPIVEKTDADNVKESTKTQRDTESEKINDKTEIEEYNSLKEDVPSTEVTKTGEEFVEKSESRNTNIVKDDDACIKVTETNSVSEVSESTNVANSEKSGGDEKFSEVKAINPSVVESSKESEKTTESGDVKTAEFSSVESRKISMETSESSDVTTTEPAVDKRCDTEKASKPVPVENVEKDEPASETKLADVNQEVTASDEISKPFEEVPQDNVEKMEVDESNTAPDSSELPTSTLDDKNTFHSTECRVVLVKVNENQGENEGLESGKKSKSPETKGIKRKRSSETEMADNISKLGLEIGKQSEKSGSPPVQKSKKQKLVANVEDKSAKDSQENDKKNPSARKSKRLSDKPKSNETNVEPTRKSARSAAKNELSSPENEKSPSKRSQLTPSSTPRKSITPSPKSKSKRETESADDKSVSENDKTPQKTAPTRVSSRTKRSLNLDNEDESPPTSVFKRQRRKSSKATPKAKAAESDDDHVSDDENVPKSTKKSRSSKSKGKSPGKSTTDDVQESQSGSDSEDEVVNKSKSSKSRKNETAKLEKMKHLLVAANLKQNNYAKFFKGCDTDKEKMDHIVEYLQENGLKGEPTLANCKALGKKIEREREAAALDKTNILNSSPSTSGTRVTRSRRSTSRRG